MTIVRLIRYKGHIIRIIHNGQKSHSYEWRIRGPRKINDPTSIGDVGSAISDAKRVIDWFKQNQTENKNDK